MSEILVTGGAGLIGSHVTDKLVEAGHRVYVIDNLSTGDRHNVNNNATLLNRDITDLKSIPEYPYDYIFHLAAKARVQPSIEDPVSWNEANVTGMVNVLERARQVGAKVIYSSSSSVYGDSVTPTKETYPIKPKSPYALQKHIGEQYLKLYSQLYDLDYTILRYFSVYGERQIPNGAYSTVVGRFLDQRKKHEPLYINGDGENRRDFTYVGDVAQANVMAMLWPRQEFNIGRGQSYSVNEIAEAIGSMRIYQDPVVEPHETLADNSKAKGMGWKTTVDVIDWIKEQV